MIEHLISLVTGAWTKIAPWFVVPVDETAAVLRFGKFHRKRGPGLFPKIPFVEEVRYATSGLTSVGLQPQSCTTKDDQAVVVRGVVRYRLADIEPYVCNVWLPHDVIVDVSMGAILRAVHSVTFEDLVNNPPEAKILDAVRKKVRRFGITVDAITFTDIGRVRSLRLISTPHAPEQHGWE